MKKVNATERKKVCVLNTHPIQYYAPLYAYLSQDEDIDLTVFYLSDLSLRGAVDSGFGRAVKWDIDLLEGYHSEFIGRGYADKTPEGFFSLLSLDVFRKIFLGKFDAIVIHGYSFAFNIIAIIAAKMSAAQVLYRADTNILIAKKKYQSKVKSTYVKAFFAACDKMLCAGTRNREFFRWMGVPERKLVDAPFTVDNAHFRVRSESTDKIAEIRARFGVQGDGPVVIFASKFIAGKNAEATITAAGAVAEAGQDFHLVMAGSGELEDELLRLAARFDRLSVSFPGFVNQSEMPDLLHIGDVFLFPSKIDAWGLVVNEAMAAGLPVIVGAESGCAPDLVEDGVNGYVVATDTDTDLKRILGSIIADPASRRSMSAASLARIDTWSLRETRDGWRRALGLSSRTTEIEA